MIINKVSPKWKNNAGVPLEEILEEYGVELNQVQEFINNKQFLIKTKYNTIVKVEHLTDKEMRITPYYSEKEETLKFVHVNERIHALSDEAERYINKETQFLNLVMLKEEGLDYYIEVKDGLTVLGIINSVNPQEFKDMNNFKIDLLRIEEDTYNDALSSPNYITVIKCYDDISLTRLKDKLVNSQKFMKDLRVYHTGIYEFSLLSKYPVNHLLTDELIVAFRSKPLTSFNSHQIGDLRKHLFLDIVTNRNEEEDNIVRGYFKALHHKTDETVEHSERMRRIVTLMGQELVLKDEEFEKLWKMSTIHDVGKLAIEGKIINKPGKLDEEEFDIVKKHTILGYEMMAGISSYADSREVCLYHHERWDGKGYPLGTKQLDIPSLVRIVTVADSIDAMASKRVYKDAFSFSYIKDDLERCQGGQFCPQTVKATLDIFEDIKRLY